MCDVLAFTREIERTLFPGCAPREDVFVETFGNRNQRESVWHVQASAA